MNTASLTITDPANPFLLFAKGQGQVSVKTTNCVIYTRVSSLKQMDNLSLETQLKYTEQYAKQKGLTVKEYFGGTYESAKTDERKEFQRMIQYVKASKQRISFILVYSLERFSRNDNSIWLAGQLRKLGVEIVSVTQPMDTSNPAGQLQQNIMFLFGVHDNMLRRQKSMAGTKERLLKGEWCNTAPIGYDNVRVNGERKVVINEKGKAIRNAFMWKLNEDCSLTEIRRRLEKAGIKLKRLAAVGEILRNPFYCGIITHNALEGQVVEGKHEKLISREVFLQVNKLCDQRYKTGYKVNGENDLLPLKGFIKCDECNNPLRGYIAKPWNLPYYKCNNPGCKNNRNANILKQYFLKEVEKYTITEQTYPVIKEQMTITFNHIIKGKLEGMQALKEKQDELTKKIDRLEERFVMEEINAEQYHKFVPKLKEELHQITCEIENSQVDGSKVENAVEKLLQYSLKLPQIWEDNIYTEKQKLQYLLFPEGMTYNRKNDECRSVTVNPIFTYIAQLSRDLEGLESENKKICEEGTGWTY